MADLMQTVVQIEPMLVDRETTAQLLGGISVDQLDKLVKAGEITPRTIGKRIVFAPAEIRRFAESRPSWEPKSAS